MSLRCSSPPSDWNRVSKFKAVLLGEQNVGKSSIVTRFLYDRFEEAYDATIGIDFLSKTFHFEGRRARLQLWDTAGQERYSSLIPGYIRNGSIAIVVYDITDRKSFAQVSKWVKQVRVERNYDAVIILVGNKTDLEERRLVSVDEGVKKARDLNVLFIEVSAKKGYNVKIMFNRLIAKMPGWESFELDGDIDEQMRMEDVRLKCIDDPPMSTDQLRRDCAC